MKTQYTEEQKRLLETLRNQSKSMYDSSQSELFLRYEPKTIVEHLRYVHESMGDVLDSLKVSTEFNYGKLVDSRKRTNPLSSQSCNHVVTVEFRDGSRKSYSNVHYPEAYANKIIKERKSGSDFWSRTWVAKIYIDQQEYTPEQHRRFTQTLI